MRAAPVPMVPPAAARTTTQYLSHARPPLFLYAMMTEDRASARVTATGACGGLSLGNCLPIWLPHSHRSHGVFVSTEFQECSWDIACDCSRRLQRCAHTSLYDTIIPEVYLRRERSLGIATVVTRRDDVLNVAFIRAHSQGCCSRHQQQLARCSQSKLTNRDSFYTP